MTRKLYLLIFYFFIFSGSALANDPITVGILQGIKQVKIESTSGFKGDRSLPGGTHLIQASSQGLIVNSHGTRANSWELTTKEGFFSVNSKRYRGSLIVKREGNALNIINKLDIEDYLLGVVPREMLPRSPIEALKAQAVVARTWALGNRNKHKSKDFELCATTCCQVYGGMDAEDPRVSKAVEETRGIILLYQGKPANTAYHSNCGGNTANNNEVWQGAPVPYLRATPCPYCSTGPHYSWVVELDPVQLAKKIPDFKGNRVDNIEIVKKDASGRVLLCRIDGPDGKSSDITGHRLRTAVGADLVWSTRFMIDNSLNSTVSGIIASLADKENRALSGNEQNSIAIGDTISTINENATSWGISSIIKESSASGAINSTINENMAGGGISSIIKESSASGAISSIIKESSASGAVNSTEKEKEKEGEISLSSQQNDPISDLIASLTKNKNDPQQEEQASDPNHGKKSGDFWDDGQTGKKDDDSSGKGKKSDNSPSSGQTGKKEKIIIRGTGFGHGIGLCQEGAVEMATQGHSFSQILYQYFAGTTLSKN